MPALRQLRSVHERYKTAETEKGKPTDYTFWYNERPNTGLLAAAIWQQKDHTALEEYRSQKGRGGAKRLGRCDLYISRRVRTRPVAFQCEAKHVWLHIDRNKSAVTKRLNECLDAAVKAVKELPERKGLALCFVSPHVHKRNRQEAGRLFEDWINQLKRQVQLPREEAKFDVLVWICLSPQREPIPDKDKYLWGGMLLLIKEVK